MAQADSTFKKIIKRRYNIVNLSEFKTNGPTDKALRSGVDKSSHI